ELTMCPSRLLAARPVTAARRPRAAKPACRRGLVRDLAEQGVLRSDAGLRGILMQTLRFAGWIALAGMLMAPSPFPRVDHADAGVGSDRQQACGHAQTRVAAAGGAAARGIYRRREGDRPASRLPPHRHWATAGNHRCHATAR